MGKVSTLFPGSRLLSILCRHVQPFCVELGLRAPITFIIMDVGSWEMIWQEEKHILFKQHAVTQLQVGILYQHSVSSPLLSSPASSQPPKCLPRMVSTPFPATVTDDHPPSARSYQFFSNLRPVPPQRLRVSELDGGYAVHVRRDQASYISGNLLLNCQHNIIA